MITLIPEGLITLGEALQSIAACLSEAHLEPYKSAAVENLRSLGKIDGVEMWAPKPQALAGEKDRQPDYPRLSASALYEWLRRVHAVIKLKVALQTGAISALVLSRERFRVPASDWCHEPLQDQMIRGGAIPPNLLPRVIPPDQPIEASLIDRTIFLEQVRFEEWLAVDQRTWKVSSPGQRCEEWLRQEMLASPTDKQQNKDAWFEQAIRKFAVSRREFNRAWASAVQLTGCSWDSPGAPRKSSRKSPH